MDNKVDIRIYHESDRQEVIRLWETVFPGGAAWNKSEEVISTKLSTQPELFFVAVQDERVLGTILAGFDGVRGWVHRLAVCPNQRRQGLASRLMKNAETSLKRIGCPKLNLQVRASNLEVLKFYESQGYTAAKRASLGKPL